MEFYIIKVGNIYASYVLNGSGEVRLNSDIKDAKPVTNEELKFILENFKEVEYKILRVVDEVLTKRMLVYQYE